MLQAAVLSLRVLAHCDQVHVVVPGLVAGQAQARSDVGEQLQLLAQGEVQGSEALANGSGHRALCGVWTLLDGRGGEGRGEAEINC